MKTRSLLLSSLFALTAAAPALAQSNENYNAFLQNSVVSGGATVKMPGFGTSRNPDSTISVSGDYAPGSRDWAAEGQLTRRIGPAGKSPLFLNTGISARDVDRDDPLRTWDGGYQRTEGSFYLGAGPRLNAGPLSLLLTANARFSSMNDTFSRPSEDRDTSLVSLRNTKTVDDVSMGRSYLMLRAEGGVSVLNRARFDFRVSSNGFDVDKNGDDRARVAVRVLGDVSATAGWHRRFGRNFGVAFNLFK